MNWRKSNAELADLLSRVPSLYLYEWTQRLDRCIAHLQAAEDHDLGSPDEVVSYTASMRQSAAWLLNVADRLDAAARRRERIAALRNVGGRTPEEASAFLAKAEKMAASNS